MTAEPAPIAITLFACNASDDAWANDLQPEIDARHQATISKETYEAIAAARAALAANPSWECIAVSSDMTSEPLETALEESGSWRTGSEEFLVYQFPGIYLRILHKDNRQAEIEFEVVRPDGTAVIPAEIKTDPGAAQAASLSLFLLSDEHDRENNRDLFVWASSPNEAVTYWQAHYEMDREPDMIWPVPTSAASPGAVAWTTPTA